MDTHLTRLPHPAVAVAHSGELLDDEDHQPTWPDPPGMLGDCVPLERLGVGHRCETWLSWSTDLWAPVVVKVARPHQVDHPRARNTLAREVAALAGLVHPALPVLVADRVGHAVPHVVTEYVDGPSLADVVDDDGPFTATEAALLGTHLLSALAQLHQRGLAHLDVKPENVVLRDGRPVLVDFGSARVVGSLQPAGHPVGTEGYAAPEMEACAPVSVAMDVFGVGATLAEALTGTPYPELAGARTGPPAHVAVGPTARTVARMLSDDPDARGAVPGLMLELAAGCDEHRPWPVRLDAYLGEAPSGGAPIPSR